MDRANINKFVLKAIKPVFKALSDDMLLSNYVNSATQNSNESFHHLISKRCSKSVFDVRRMLEVAVYKMYNISEA